MGLYSTVENHEKRLDQLGAEIAKLGGKAPAKITDAPAQKDPQLDQHEREIGEIRSELSAMYDVFAKLGDRIGSLEDAKAAHEMELAAAKKSFDKDLAEAKKSHDKDLTDTKKSFDKDLADIKKSLADIETRTKPSAAQDTTTTTTRVSAPVKATASSSGPSNGPSGGSGQAKAK